MKKISFFVLSIIMAFSLIGCSLKDNDLSLLNGEYIAVGQEYENQTQTPSIVFNTEENVFSFNNGTTSSTVNGTYKVRGQEVIAVSDDLRLEFKIIDRFKLVLVNISDDFPFDIPINTQFVFVVHFVD